LQKKPCSNFLHAFFIDFLTQESWLTIWLAYWRSSRKKIGFLLKNTTKGSGQKMMERQQLIFAWYTVHFTSYIWGQYASLWMTWNVSYCCNSFIVVYYFSEYQLFFYEARDKPSPVKKDFKQDRLKDKAMANSVHLRNVTLDTFS
jgi:hypothetical protein